MTFWTELMETPHELRWVDAGGVRTRSLRAGSGDPVLFLHGISGHIEAYIPQVALHADQADVHLIDMLGHGFTGKPDEPYTIARYGRHVIDYLDAQGLDKVSLVGLSLGGWVSAHVAATYPDRVSSLTLVCSAGSPQMNTPEVLSMIRSTTMAASESDDRSLTRQRLEKVVHHPESVTDELVDVRYRIYHDPQFRASLQHVMAVVRDDVADVLTPEVLARITCEVLVVWSEYDVLSDVTGAGNFTAHLPRAKLVVVKDAGHWPPFERPEAFAQVNLAFLAGGLAAVTETTV